MNSQEKLLDIWHNDLYLATHAHYDAATRCERRHCQLGITSTILAAAVGTTIFATYAVADDWRVRIGTGLVSFGVAGIAALQTFLRQSERGEKHRLAAARFAAILKEIEFRKRIPHSDAKQFEIWAEDLRVRWDKLSLDSPTCPKDIFEKHRQKHKYTKLADDPKKKSNSESHVSAQPDT